MSNIINIGTDINLEILLESKLLVEADSGSGKSWLIRKLAEECSGKVQQIIIDPEGEFVTLREKYPFALVGKGKEGDLPVSIRYAEALAYKILETGISVIIDLYEFKQPEREQFVKLFTEALMNAPKNMRHSCLIYLDEAQLFCPEDKRALSTAAVIDLCTRGRKRGLCAILATLRISILNKSAAAQCKNKMMGSTSLPLDQKRVGEELGLRTKEEVRDLRNLHVGEFYTFGPAISKEIMRFTVAQVKTTHVRSGTKLLSLPPTPKAIKNILSKLEAIPEEAEKELINKQQFLAEIARLKSELKKAQAPVKTPVTGTGNNDLVNEKEITRLTDELDNLKSQYIDLLGIAGYYKKHALILKSLPDKIKSVIPDELQFIDVHELPVLKNNKPIFLKDIPRFTVQKNTTPVNNIREKTEKQQPSLIPADASQSLPPGEKAVLIACAMYENGLARNQITVLTTYKRSSRDQYIQRLRQKGFIEQNGDRIIITDNGKSVLGDNYQPLPQGQELQDYWLNKLPPGEAAVLKVLIEAYPNIVDREIISQRTGYKRSSRDQYIQRMNSKEIIVIAGRGGVAASANLFD